MRQIKISKSITSREFPSLGKYLQEISKIDLLTAEEEAELSRKIRQGDKRALDKLVKANLRFVVSVAKQFQGQGLPLTDLINEGNIGLIKAAEKYDETRGFKFISFAVWWIRQTILEGLALHARLIRLPMNKIMLSSRIRKTNSQLEQKLEREPSQDELAEALQVSFGDLHFNLSNAHPVSLDSPFSEGEDGCLADVIENHNAPQADKDLSHRESLKTEINRSLKILTEKQRDMICYYYGIGIDQPLTLEDIANKYDLSVERVRQIKDKALLQLKSTRHLNLLRGFL
jgi:RNA polymerase primary sigma factor